MKNTKTPEQIKADIVSRSLAMLLQRINTSKKNAKTLFSLLEKIECDPDLTQTEKKQLVGKINNYFLLSTGDLLEIVDALSGKETQALPEQVRVIMEDEVRKWAT